LHCIFIAGILHTNDTPACVRPKLPLLWSFLLYTRVSFIILKRVSGKILGFGGGFLVSEQGNFAQQKKRFPVPGKEG
jgi:hypothetical protein